jgi:hypothetical protein
VNIVINGKVHNIDAEEISYGEIAKLAEEGEQPSIVYKVRKGKDLYRTGCVSPGNTLKLEDGMIINAIETGKA